jgi:hypothetical protein
MKKTLSITLIIFLSFLGTSYQHHYNTTDVSHQSFKNGEWLKFRIHYGFINAGYATLELENSYKNGQILHHAKGKGWTVGAAKLFYTIDDNYESYFTKDKIKPIEFKRRVDEDGYIIRRDLFFDHSNKQVTIQDLEKNTEKQVAINNVQDMVSAFYYLRNIDFNNIKEGDEQRVDLFFDGETFPFKLKFLEIEEVSTRLGTIEAWKIRPLVQKGRVFEGQESLTIWISNDKNKIPVRIKASLVVGSLKADLDDYSGLVENLNFVN